MIGTCRQVPANPARNLNEALQCFILITFIVNYIVSERKVGFQFLRIPPHDEK